MQLTLMYEGTKLVGHGKGTKCQMFSKSNSTSSTVSQANQSMWHVVLKYKTLDLQLIKSVSNHCYCPILQKWNHRYALFKNANRQYSYENLIMFSLYSWEFRPGVILFCHHWVLALFALSWYAPWLIDKSPESYLVNPLGSTYYHVTLPSFCNPYKTID